MSDESFLVPESDSEVLPKIIDADPFHVEPMSLAAQAFDDEPPTLKQLAYDSEPLQTIAEHMHILMTQEGDVKYNQKTRESLERVITVFVYQSAKLSVASMAPLQLPGTTQKAVENKEKPEDQPNVSVNEFKKITRQLLKSQEELAECQHKYALAEQREQILRKEIQQLQQENDVLFKDKSALISKLQATRREFDNTEGELKGQILKLKDENSNLKDNANQTNFNTERLQKQFNTVTEELATTTAANIRLQTKLDSKNERIKQLRQKLHETELEMHNTRAENEEFSIQIGDLTTKIEQLAEQLQNEGPETVELLKSDKSRLEAALDAALKHIEEQSLEIKQLSEARTKFSSIINRQMELVRSYDTHADLLNEERNADTTIIQPPTQQIVVERSMEESQKSNPVAESLYNAVLDILKPRFGKLQNDDVLDVIDSLVKGTADTDMSEMNKRLLTLIENQLRFLSQMANNGTLQLYLLSSGQADEIYMDQEPFRNQILVEIARCRSFITLSKAQLPAEDITPTIAKTKLDSVNDSKDLAQREAFDIAALQSANANIIRVLGERLAEKNANFIEGLSAVAKMINYEGEVEEIMPTLLAKIRSFNACAKACSDADGAFDYNNYDESVEKIEEIYRRNALVAGSLVKELQEVTNYDGTVEDLPSHAHKFIDDVLKELEGTIQTRAKDLLAQAEEFAKRIEEDKAASTKQIGDLEATIEELTDRNNDLNATTTKQLNEIRSLNQELADITARKEDFESKYNALNKNMEEVESEMQRLRNEMTSLETLMQQKDQTFEQRMKKVLETERKSHAEEVDHQDAKMKEMIAKHEEELNNKINQLREAKKKLRTVITTYDEAFKKQKLSMGALRQQNQSLLQRLAQATGTGSKPVDQSDGRALMAEKQILEVRLKQANENVEKIAAAKDAYWQSQLAVVESKLEQDCENKLAEQKKKHEGILSNVIGQIEKYVKTVFDGSDDCALSIAKEAAEKIVNSDKQRAIAEKKFELILEQKRKLDSASVDDLPKVVKLIKSLKDWEKWARDIYQNVADRDPKQDTNEELRTKLSDLIILASAQARAMNRIESLRSQKKALLSHAGDVKAPGVLTSGSLAKVVLFATRISKLGVKTVSVIPTAF